MLVTEPRRGWGGSESSAPFPRRNRQQVMCVNSLLKQLFPNVLVTCSLTALSDDLKYPLNRQPCHAPNMDFLNVLFILNMHMIVDVTIIISYYLSVNVKVDLN